jgi:internalin A
MITQPAHEPAPPKKLLLAGQQDLSALQALADPSQLTTLTLDNCPLSDLSPLAQLPQLTRLTLRYCNQVSDLAPLAGLPQLSTLYLRGNGRAMRASRLHLQAALPQLTIVR